jgi:hypothetical protein
MAPLIRAFISPDEVYPGREVTYDEVATVAGTLNRTEALRFLGYLNLLLSSAATESHLKNDLKPVHEVQTWLFREIVGAELLKDLKARFRDASLLDRPVLHRAQLMFAIRLVATHGMADGGNMLMQRADFDTIGDLVFLISGLFKMPPRTSGAATALWLATDVGPSYELENSSSDRIVLAANGGHVDSTSSRCSRRPRGIRATGTHHRIYDGFQPTRVARS